MNLSPHLKAHPFLKWAGGKGKLLAQYEAFFPLSFKRYIEPFVGGGAVFFHLWNTQRLPGEVFLFDSNPQLVNTYRVVRDHLDQLVELLSTHQSRHSRDYYYSVRGLDRPEHSLGAVERAARMIYLNKTCYNGLFRVNRKGQFNVPMGSYQAPRIFDEEALTAASQALQATVIETRDFRTLVDFARPRDFFYFDPPYAPTSKTANFTSYTSGSFGESDQRELAEAFAGLAHKGCLCMLSNSYTPFILGLYSRFRIEIVSASRAINSNPSNRGNIKEVLVLNYP